MDEYKFLHFIKDVSNGYKNVPYHNRTHATDVTQTSTFYVDSCQFKKKVEMDDIDVSSMLLATACHDYAHPGYNNVYMVETFDQIAYQYNDKAVLESYHIANSMMLTRKKNNDIFDGMERDQKKAIRERMILMVLATDMAEHFKSLGKLKAKLAAEDFDPKNPEEKLFLMGFVVHMSDISNPTKKWDLCFQWTELLFCEFFSQRDKEREQGLNISYLMDRNTINIAKAQVGFIDVIIKPAFEALATVIPRLKDHLHELDNNRERWAQRQDNWVMIENQKYGPEFGKSLLRSTVKKSMDLP